MRIEGSKVDLSSLFESFNCIAADGTKVTVAEGQTCECGLSADGTVLQKIDKKNSETGQTEKICPLDQQTTPSIPLVAVSDGTYTKLVVEYSGQATMKGCVSGFFRESNTKTEPDTRYTYCTTSGKSFFDTTVDAKATEFESNEDNAATIKVPVARLAGAVSDISFFNSVSGSSDIPGGITIAAGATADLTMVIDTNRMLRFENGGRTDRTPVFTTWSADRAYFFNSVFNDSAFVFVGKPGTIQGYSWTSTSCLQRDKAKASDTDYTCALNQSYQSVLVGGWLTIIKQTDGTPRILSFMPDDDDTLTVIKGNNIRRNACTNTSETDASYFSTNADGSNTLKYALGADPGSIKISLPTEVGSTASGTFDGFQQSYGPIEIKREL